MEKETKRIAVNCTTQYQWDTLVATAPGLTLRSNLFGSMPNDDAYKEGYAISLSTNQWCRPSFYREEADYELISFIEWVRLNELKIEEPGMEKLMLEVLSKTYDNPKLREKTVPLFMSNPGIGKTTIIRKFAEDKGVKLEKITLSQRMPNEVVGGVMPNSAKGIWETLDNEQLKNLKHGDILFLDEVFNGTLKQTLDAALNLLEDRMLPSGLKLANVMIVAASNPQGLIHLTPQIKERFIRYDLEFSRPEYQHLLKQRYGMPEDISRHLCTMIEKEKFDALGWNFITPRSLEKAINQIGCDLDSPYSEMLMPYLSVAIKSPVTIPSAKIEKDQEVPYLEFLKLLVKNDNKNHKSESPTASHLSS